MIAAQCLHGGIVNQLDRTPERRVEIKANPASSRIMRFMENSPIDDWCRNSDGNCIVFPVRRELPDEGALAEKKAIKIQTENAMTPDIWVEILYPANKDDTDFTIPSEEGKLSQQELMLVLIELSLSIFDQLIKSRKGRCTLIVSSHNLQELEEICDGAAILDRGRVVASGSMNELTASSEEIRIRLSPGASRT